MLRYLSLEIICSSMLTIFLELRSRKTVRFSEQTMSADKYPGIFSPKWRLLFIYAKIIFIFKCSIVNYSISYICTVSCNNYVLKLFSRNDRQSEEFTTLLKEKDDQIAQLLEEGKLTHEHSAALCSTYTSSRLNR